MNITSALRAVFLAGALWVSAQAQSTDPLREASLIDNMLCRGDYLEALKLTKRDFLYAKVDRVPLVPYVGALFIETGKLKAADQILNQQPADSRDQGSRSALVRERAALLFARGEYKLGAAEAVQAYKFSRSDGIYKSRRAYAGSIAAESLLRSGDLNGAREYADQSLKAVQKQTGAAFFLVPRVFYGACLVASYGSSPQTAEPICLHGLALAKRSQRPRRDLSLGYLALAEARLRAGRAEASREAANQSLTLNKRAFWPRTSGCSKGTGVNFVSTSSEGQQSRSAKGSPNRAGCRQETLRSRFKTGSRIN